jgi:predicted O-linked N-acetylglucosamine transferase (SPINDLY family)
MSPTQFQSQLQQAVAHHRANRLKEAEMIYQRLRAADPKNFDALHLSGLVAYQQGRHADAVALLTRALKRNPASAVCAMRLGMANTALHDFPVSERHLRAALKLDPSLAEAWCHLSVTLGAQGRLAEARSGYEQAVKLKPDYAEAYDRMGALACQTGGFAAAVPYFRRVTALQPDDPTGWANLGATLAQSGGLEECFPCFDRALALAPTHSLALTARAVALLLTYRLREAVAGYGEVIAIHPQNFEARSGRLLTQHYLDDIDRSALFAEHVAFGAACDGPGQTRLPNLPEPARRLRVAFLSADLRRHSVAYFLAPLVEHLDPAEFELYLYHDHAQVDDMSARLRARAAVWRNFIGQTLPVIEAAIRADAPDVLIDLAGHTGINRLPLFARRLAPVQITWLGYPDTTGVRAMDYRFVDAITDPVGEAEPFHTERLVRFAPTAWLYQPPLDAPAPAPVPCAAGASVTFGCFNNFAKVSDSTLRGWAQVLASVPHSRLLLKGHGLGEPARAAVLRARLALLGVAQERIELLGRTPGVVEHLALYARVDVALDTFPYHGTTTTCEALWMGVPVVTLAGDRHAARVGVSLLTAIGHPEWIARDWTDYVVIATALANDTTGRAVWRQSLRGELRRSALLDHAGQAVGFGAAVRECWQHWCREHQPATMLKPVPQLEAAVQV